jgi:hypothetical protein
MRQLMRWGQQVLAPIVSFGWRLERLRAERTGGPPPPDRLPHPQLQPWLPLCEFRKTEVRARVFGQVRALGVSLDLLAGRGERD